MLCRRDGSGGDTIVVGGIGGRVELKLSLLGLRMLWAKGELRGHTCFVSRAQIVEQE